jgi:hypothetical protein
VRCEREEEAVEAEVFECADPAARCFPNVFDIRIGVSYFTNEKLFDADVVIFR